MSPYKEQVFIRGIREITKNKIYPINDTFPQYDAKTLDCSYWVESFNLTLAQEIKTKGDTIGNLECLKKVVNSQDFQTKLRQNLVILKETQRIDGKPIDGGNIPKDRSNQIEMEQILLYFKIPSTKKDNIRALSNIKTGVAIKNSQEPTAFESKEPTSEMSKVEILH